MRGWDLGGLVGIPFWGRSVPAQQGRQPEALGRLWSASPNSATKVLCGLGQFLSSGPLRAALGTVREECRSGACPSSLQLRNGETLVPDRGHHVIEEQDRGGRGRLVGDKGREVLSWQRDARGQVEMLCSGCGGVLGVGKDENKDKHVGPKCAGQDPGASSEGRSWAAGGPPIRRPGRGHLEGTLALSSA